MSSSTRHRGRTRDHREYNDDLRDANPCPEQNRHQHTHERSFNRPQNSRTSHRSRDRSRSPRINANNDRDDRRSDRREHYNDMRGHSGSSSKYSSHHDHRRDSGRDRYRDRDYERSHSRGKTCDDRDYRTISRQVNANLPPKEADEHETIDEISPTPTNCLLLRKLAPCTTEERILEKLGFISSVELKNIRVLRKKTGESRGLCIIELRSITEAHQLYNRLTSVRPPFEIDGNVIISSFGKKQQMLTSSAASAALEAARWSNRSSSNPETESLSTDNTLQTTNTNSDQSKLSNQATISSLGTVNMAGSVYKKWPIPDITTYVLEETSGFLYDHLTGYYYDSKSRYYYDSANTRYLYYDPEHQAYLPAEFLLKKNDSKSEKSTESTQLCTQTKQEKVKTTTKVAKDMEKWARTLNQKRDSLKSNEPSGVCIANEEDIHKAISIDTDRKKKSPWTKSSTTLTNQTVKLQSPDDSASSRNFEASSNDDLKATSIDLKSLLKAEEEKLLDYDNSTCLLCKRVLNSKELLIKHREKSDMHASNLDKLKTEMFTKELIEECERRDRDRAYRDRALERRLRHGLPDDIVDIIPESKHSREIELDRVSRHCRDTDQSSRVETPLSLDSKGVCLLSKMGWKEGTGIGRSNQGIKDIIKVEARVGKAGLGVKMYKHDPGTSYKEAVKQVMYQRYRELADDDS